MHGSRALDPGAAGCAAAREFRRKPRRGCAVCVPFPYLAQVAERLRGSPIAWGAQNVSEHAQGAYTGEVSAAMLAEFGCRYVIVGHSERRQLYGETDALVAAKFAAAQQARADADPLRRRDARRSATPGRTEAVVARQLRRGGRCSRTRCSPTSRCGRSAPGAPRRRSRRRRCTRFCAKAGCGGGRRRSCTAAASSRRTRRRFSRCRTSTAG